MSDRSPVSVPRSVAVVIERIRQAGACNMMDFSCVQREAYDLGEFVTVQWLTDHQRQYGRLIMAGMTLVDDAPDPRCASTHRPPGLHCGTPFSYSRESDALARHDDDARFYDTLEGGLW